MLIDSKLNNKIVEIKAGFSLQINFKLDNSIKYKFQS